MKKLIIKRLLLENFKCHDRLEVTLQQGLNRISGPPGWGRTSLLDGLCWALYGKDFSGSTGAEIRPVNAFGRPRDSLALTQAALDLTFDGRELSLRRCLRKTAGGDLVTEFYVNGIPCRKNYYRRQVEEMVSEPVFYLLSQPLWFFTKLSWEDQRTLLLTLLSKGRNPEENRDCQRILNLQNQLKEEKQSVCREASDLPYRISEMEGTLRQLGIPDYDGLAARRKALSEERQRLLPLPHPDSGRIRLLNDQIAQLDRTLGTRTMVISGGRRLLKLRDDQQRMLKQLRSIKRREEELERQMDEKIQAVRKAFFPLSGALDLKRQGEGYFFTCSGIPFKNLSRTQRLNAGIRMTELFSSCYDLQVPMLIKGPCGVSSRVKQVISLESGKGKEVRVQ